VGPTHRREREKQILRQRILDASRQLFAERGYESVTLRTIAEAIEYSPRTIYLHFKDKEDLIRELCREDFRSFGEGLGQLAQIADPLERLRAIGHAYAQFSMAYPHHYKLMFMTPPAACPVGEAADQEGKGDPEADAYALLRSCIADGLQQGCFRPDLQEADLLAQVVWSGLHGVMALAITHQSDPWVPWAPVQQRVDLMLEVLTRGLRA